MYLTNLNIALQPTYIFCCRYANTDGTNRHIVMQGKVPHPFAITLFEDYMYWTDWNHKSVEKANRFTGANHTVLQHVTHRPMDVHIYHPLQQPKGLGGSVHCYVDDKDCVKR